MQRYTKKEAAEVYVRHYTGTSVCDEALWEYALEAYVGSYESMAAWGAEAMADMTPEEIGGRDVYDFIQDCSAQAGGTVDFIPVLGGVVLVFDENKVP